MHSDWWRNREHLVTIWLLDAIAAAVRIVGSDEGIPSANRRCDPNVVVELQRI
jgi:hypothetical protein